MGCGGIQELWLSDGLILKLWSAGGKLELLLFSILVHLRRQLLVDHAVKLASQIAARSPVAIQGSKVNLNYARDHTIAQALQYQVRSEAPCPSYSRAWGGSLESYSWYARATELCSLDFTLTPSSSKSCRPSTSPPPLPPAVSCVCVGLFVLSFLAKPGGGNVKRHIFFQRRSGAQQCCRRAISPQQWRRLRSASPRLLSPRFKGSFVSTGL